jgi:hypothetical protein
MANIQKTLTYKIPNTRHTDDDSEGKTSTCEYNGPSLLKVWIDRETGGVDAVFDADDMTEQPLPLDKFEVDLDCNDDNNAIIGSMIYGGIADPLRFEIQVGPADENNILVTDPTDIMEVYSKEHFNTNAVNEESGEWKSLIYKEACVEISDEQVRSNRNSVLEACDNMIAEDMPEAVKQQWMDYRQKLRDLPANWANVPNEFIAFPDAPDGKGYDCEYDDTIIQIADRNEYATTAMLQLTAVVGIDEG